MPTKQVIEIDVTWTSWNRLKLKTLIAWLASIEGLDIKRITVREIKKR